MRRGSVAFLALTLIGLGVTGCGLYRYEQREPWRAQAEEACLSQKLVQPSAYMSRMSPIDGPGSCGISYPFKVAAFAGGSVGLTSKVTLGCPIIPSIDGWLNEVVQPAAATYFGTSVAEVRSGSYSCRPRNNQPGAKVSEHAYGNAVDIMAFRLADRREITVVKGWKGSPEEQDFLRQVFVGACEYFTTVLGPGADVFHYDHIHLDLARHDPRGQRHYCKPVLKFTPRQDVYSGAPVRRAPPEGLRSPQPLPDIDIDEDHDPFAVSSAPRRSPVPAQPVAAARPSSPALDLPAPMAARGVGRNDPFAVSAQGSATSIPPAPPARSPVSTPAPLPPPRYTRGYEPIPAYEPPPAQRSGPLVLQPSSRAGQPIY
jgi:hypothetical protein